MSAIPYPDGVPSETRIGTWRLAKPSVAPLRTSLEDGIRRSRRSSTKNIATIAFSIVPMTRAQFDVFRAWVRDTLFDGTHPDGFTMSVFDGRQYVSRTCHMNADPPYEAATEGLMTVVSFSELDVEDL